MQSFKTNKINCLLRRWVFQLRTGQRQDSLKRPLYRVAKNARKRQLSCLEVGVVEASVVFSELVLQQKRWIWARNFSLNNAISIKNLQKSTSEGVGKRCRSATESQKSRRASDRQKLWFVDPPWDSRLGVIREAKRVKKGAKRSFEEAVNVNCLKNRFL